MTPKISTFTGHRDCVYALCAGPSDHEFFSAGADGWIVLWHLDHPEEGKLIARFSGSVYAILYLAQTHRLLVAVNLDGFHLIDLNSGAELWNHATPGSRWFRMLENPDGTVVAAGSKGQLAILDPEKRQFGMEILHPSDIRALDRHPGTGQLALGNAKGEIMLPGPEKNRFSGGHHSTVFGLSFYPFSPHLVSCGKDARLILWKKQEDSSEWFLEKEVPAHLFGIHDVKAHPDKPILATCSMDKTLKIWDAESLRLLRVLDKTRHAGHGHSINQLLWMGKRELLLSCSDDRTISAWDIYR